MVESHLSFYYLQLLVSFSRSAINSVWIQVFEVVENEMNNREYHIETNIISVFV